MTTHSSLRLALHPGPDESRIAGRLYDERGERHDFSSWLGLLPLLENARLRASSLPHGNASRDAVLNPDHNPQEER